jgi:predicted restriction endonuclease
VQDQTGRSKKSVEFKFCNISALLREMGHPFIQGYKPLSNTQRGSLYSAIRHELLFSEFPVPYDQIEQEFLFNNAFDPPSTEDARERIFRAIVIRRGQPKFRKDLIDAYDGKCAVTGYDSDYALEACHILPYRGEQTNHVTNGLLLRSDIHTLFDLGKTAVNTDNMSLIIADALKATRYRELDGAALHIPRSPLHRPNLQSLDNHRQLIGL